MQRYFLSESDFKNQHITGEDQHHIVKVMRMKPMDQMIVCYDDHCFLSELKSIEPKVVFDVIREINHAPYPFITIFQGLPKGHKLETVVKYGTIYGASKIVFLEMERSIAKEKNSENKMKRLVKIAKEASELAHRYNVPEIGFIKQMKSIDFNQYDVVLVADENEKTRKLDDQLKDVNPTQKIAIIIGPEGGITDQERDYLKSQNGLFVSLGNYILPTEIACLYPLTYISLKNNK